MRDEGIDCSASRRKVVVDVVRLWREIMCKAVVDMGAGKGIIIIIKKTHKGLIIL